MTCLRWPRLTDQQLADIASRRSKGETWPMLSQVYQINAEALKTRFEKARGKI
jgi:hypothetical protein